ncbi:hypothetical protein ACVOMT_13615 [Sphingomonas panni]
MMGNLDPSARVAMVGVIPAQQAAVGAISSGWVDMRNAFEVLATLNIGVIGAAGTIDARIEQATDVNGAGAKPVAGLAVAQIVKAGGDNRQAAITLRQEDMDKNAGYRFARITVTVGGAASFLSAMLVAFDLRYGAGGANQLSSVAQTVS